MKEIRNKKKYTQKYVADVLGVHITYISRIENKKVTPSIKTAVKLAKLYGTSLDEIARSIGIDAPKLLVTVTKNDELIISVENQEVIEKAPYEVDIRYLT